MRKIYYSGSTPGSAEKYQEDLRYWSNACGELHRYGERDITEEELPPELQKAYSEIWEECPWGLFCYLAEYEGKTGIALIAEYHEYTDEGYEGEENNNEQANKVMKLLAQKYQDTDYVLIKGRELGFPGRTPEGDGDNATELVLFLPCPVSKEEFDAVTDYFGHAAYR